MKGHPDLPSLRIVSTPTLLAHEELEAGRADPLVRSLETDGILRNPPVVARLPGREERYVVLDGANRLAAFRFLNLPYALVQVAEPETSAIDVRTWRHVLIGSPVERRDLMRSLEGTAHRLPSTHSPPEGQAPHVQFQLAEGEMYSLQATGASLTERLALVHQAMGTYLGRLRMERTVSSVAQGLARIYPDFAGLVVYPRFSMEDVFELARDGQRLPAGLTRFVVSPRVLHVDYPLEELRRPGSLGGKRRAFGRWLAERIRARAVRYYAESTFLFDE